MDKRVLDTLAYTMQETEELAELTENDQISENELFIQLFSLGKVLVGWDDEKNKFEQIGFLMGINEKVALMKKGQDSRSRFRS